MQLHNLASNIFTIDYFLTKEECASFVGKTEGIGYEPATIDTEKG